MMRTRVIRYRLRPQDQIFFMHIPKAGGTTLTNILQSIVGPDKFLSMDPLLSYLKQASSAEVERYRIIRAHFGYQAFRHLRRRPVYMTMLRQPVNRVLSHYVHFQLHKPERVVKAAEQLYPGREPETLTLEEFLGIRHLSNLQTRYLAGLPDQEFAQWDHEDILALAKAHLDMVTFFGVVERYEDSMRLMSYTFDWPDVQKFQRLNEAPEGKKPALSPEQIEIIRQHNQLDLALYEFALREFEIRLEQMNVELGAQTSA